MFGYQCNYLQKAQRLLSAVKITLKLIFPPRTQTQIFDAPPLGLIPVKNNPNRIETDSINMSFPRM